jgi:hypothetical protein
VHADTEISMFYRNYFDVSVLVLLWVWKRHVSVKSFPFFPCKTKAWRWPHKRSKRVADCRPAAVGKWISKVVSDALTHLTAQQHTILKLYFRPPLPHKIHNRNVYNVRSAANEFVFCSSQQQSRSSIAVAGEPRLAAKLCTFVGSSQ